jgi:4-amino-4-deoxy-L-arabinose transferase-like glycosyltransferase
MLVSLGTIILYLRTSRIVWIIVFGVICALNSLVRGGNLFLPIVVALGLLALHWRNWKRLVPPLLAMTVAFVVTLLPWTIRNYRVFHHVVPIATQDGLTLYGSYWPPERNSRLIWGTLPGHEDPAIQAAEQTGDEVSASTYLNQLTRQRLR